MLFRGAPNPISKRFCPRAGIHTLEFPRKLSGWRRIHAFLKFIELANNSRDFTSPERPLVVEVCAEARGHGPQRRLSLIYADNGRGVRPEHKDRIFDTFESHREGIGKPGKGVGLSYVRRVVSAEAGAVREEGVFGQGARFSFDLPWPEPDEPQPSEYS